MTDLLELEGITKRYGATVANDAIDLCVPVGAIHGVIGENGAGKSTLMRIVCGVTRPDDGHIRWCGQAVSFSHPARARSLGIAMVFQQGALFDSLTVSDNLSLAAIGATAASRPEGGARDDDIDTRITRLCDRYGLAVDPTARVGDLDAGRRQQVEIVRALSADPKLLILDEPTSVLPPQAIGPLFGLLRRLADDGCAVLYVTHKLDEVRQLCDTATVLRGGRVIATVRPFEESEASLTRLMIGNPPQAAVRGRPPRAGAPLLAVDRLTVVAAEGQPALDAISFGVAAGEIVGIAGLAGSGQRTLVRVLGGQTRVEAGPVRFGEADIGAASPAQRRDCGLRVVPAERLGEGAVGPLPLWENVALTAGEPARGPFGLLRSGWLHRRAAELIDRFQLRTAGADVPAATLSGGQLQKFIVARELADGPRALVIDQPTRGLDVASAVRVHRALLELRDAGAAVLVISDDIDELLTLCSRLHVMCAGRLSPSLDVDTIDVEQLGRWMAGDFAGPPRITCDEPA